MLDGQFPLTVVRGVLVVTAAGDIDATNAAQLSSALLAAAEHGQGTLVADLTRTEFCDASGLRSLLGARQQARAAGGDVLLVSRGPGMLRILAVTRADRCFRNFTSVDEALAHAAASGSARSGGHRLPVGPGAAGER